jgi:hypothetical protein
MADSEQVERLLDGKRQIGVVTAETGTSASVWRYRRIRSERCAALRPLLLRRPATTNR